MLGGIILLKYFCIFSHFLCGLDELIDDSGLNTATIPSMCVRYIKCLWLSTINSVELCVYGHVCVCMRVCVYVHVRSPVCFPHPGNVLVW